MSRGTGEKDGVGIWNRRSRQETKHYSFCCLWNDSLIMSDHCNSPAMACGNLYLYIEFEDCINESRARLAIECL